VGTVCGRIVWVWDKVLARWVQHYDDAPSQDVRHVLEKRRYNVPPASHLPVILPRDAASAARGPDRFEVTVARWGFPIPARPNGVFNTRIETAAESPLWRGMLGVTHCVFPATAFYEWKRVNGKRSTPYFIHRKDGAPLALAGLRGSRTVRGRQELCGSIVTCAPNAFMAELHDRMPVVLEADAVASWLRPERAGLEAVLDLAVPGGDVLERHEVTRDVNSTANDEPRLVEPVAQRRLF
jgi:putative SOS response-associated peptidase YedK